MAVATLTVRLGAQIAEFQSEFKSATKSAQKFADDFEGVATKAAAVGTFFGTIAADIAKSLAVGLGSALRDAVKFSSEFNNAFLGLGSVARAFGTDTATATAAAKKLSADGLLPLKDSATGLKNLLAAGFNLDQSTKLMNAFKDSAAFGRQGALSFGDAIRSATEGVKNGNSILVDNAGVTKNLSQILKEAGFSAQDLSRASSDAGVRMALFNGILKETRAQTGDAAKLTQTYSGQVTALETAYNTLLAKAGDAITQNKDVAIAIGFVGDVVRNLTVWLGENGRGFNFVSDAVILFAKSISATINVIDLVQTAFSGLQISVNTVFATFANVGIALFKLTERVENLQKVMDPIAFTRHAAAAEEARQAYTFLEGATKGLADASKSAQDRSVTWGNALQGARVQVDGLVKELEAARGKTVEFGDVVNAPPKPGGVVPQTAEDLKKLAKAAADAAKSIAGIFDDIFDVRNKVEKMADKFNEAIQGIKDRLNGVDFVAKAQLWAAALEETGAAAKVLADDALRKELAEIIDGVTRKFGSLKAAGVGALDAIADKVKAIKGRDLSGIVPQIGAAAATGGNLSGVVFKEASAAAGIFAAVLGTVTGAFNQMGQVAGGVLGRVLSDVGGIVGGLGSLAPLIGSVQKGFSNIAGAFASIAAVGVTIGTALRPLLSLSEGKLGALLGTNNTGRSMVVDFANSLGGFDALQKKLQESRTDWEKFWIAATQGVGRSNPEQAAAAIKAIQDAINNPNTPAANAAAAGFQTRAELQALADKAKSVYEFMRDSGLFTAASIEEAFKRMNEAAALAMDDAAKKAADAAKKAKETAQAVIDSLDTQIKSLRDSIAGEAPEEFIGIIEANTRKQIEELQKKRDAATEQMKKDDEEAAAAAVKAVQGLAEDAGRQTVDAILKAIGKEEFRVKVKVDFDGGSSSGSRPPIPPDPSTSGASSGSRSGGTAVFMLDNRVIAEGVVPFIPGVVKKYVGR